jgi:hypothetical protein
MEAERGAESFDGGGDGGIGVLAASLDDAGDEGTVIGGADVDRVAVFAPLAVQEKTVSCDRRDRHLGHGSGPLKKSL